MNTKNAYVFVFVRVCVICDEWKKGELMYILHLLMTFMWFFFIRMLKISTFNSVALLISFLLSIRPIRWHFTILYTNAVTNTTQQTLTVLRSHIVYSEYNVTFVFLSLSLSLFHSHFHFFPSSSLSHFITPLLFLFILIHATKPIVHMRV